MASATEIVRRILERVTREPEDSPLAYEILERLQEKSSEGTLPITARKLRGSPDTDSVEGILNDDLLVKGHSTSDLTARPSRLLSAWAPESYVSDDRKYIKLRGDEDRFTLGGENDVVSIDNRRLPYMRDTDQREVEKLRAMIREMLSRQRDAR